MNRHRLATTVVGFSLILTTTLGCSDVQREVSNDATAAPEPLDATTSELQDLARTTALQIAQLAERIPLYRSAELEDNGGLLSSLPTQSVFGEPQRTPSLQLSRNFNVDGGEASEPDTFGSFELIANAPTTSDKLCEVRISYNFTTATRISARQPLSAALISTALQSEVERGKVELNSITIYPSVDRTYGGSETDQLFLYVDGRTGEFGKIVDGESRIVPSSQFDEYKPALTRAASCVMQGFK